MNVWLEKNIQIAGCLLSVWDFNDLCSFLLATPLTPNNPGTMGGLFLDGEESPALEDISKWTVEDVCSFVSSLSGCTEYTQVNPCSPGLAWQEQPQSLSGLFLVDFYLMDCQPRCGVRNEGAQQVRMGIGAGLGLSLSPGRTGFVKTTWKSSLAVEQTGEGDRDGMFVMGMGHREPSKDRDLGCAWVLIVLRGVW